MFYVIFRWMVFTLWRVAPTSDSSPPSAWTSGRVLQRWRLSVSRSIKSSSQTQTLLSVSKSSLVGSETLQPLFTNLTCRHGGDEDWGGPCQAWHRPGREVLLREDGRDQPGQPDVWRDVGRPPGRLLPPQCRHCEEQHQTFQGRIQTEGKQIVIQGLAKLLSFPIYNLQWTNSSEVLK